jgi:hypothetical protein
MHTKIFFLLGLLLSLPAFAGMAGYPGFTIGSVNYFGPRCAHGAAATACTNDTAGTVVTLICRTTAGNGTCSGRLNDSTAGWTSALKLRITSIQAIRAAAGEFVLGYSDNDGQQEGSVSYTNFKPCTAEVVGTAGGWDTTTTRTYNLDCVVPAGKFVSGNQALAGSWLITGVLE